jgi:iron complex outermembrane receptor protein
VTLQLGGRYERASFDVDSVAYRDRGFNNASASAGLIFRPTEQTTVAFSVARAARHPSLEELYYFGPHPGNFAFEIGNDDLTSERALGIDLALRWRLPRASGEVAFFRNDINDFIFRRPVSEEEFDERFGEPPSDDHEGHAHEDFPIVEYVDADSVLQGVEAHADVDLTPWLGAEVSLDYVRGDLKREDQPLPRMPPFRFITGLRYRSGGLQIGGDVTLVAEQDRVFADEPPTDGYHTLKIFGSYSFVVHDIVHTVTARVDNVTNELYRNHLSLIKESVAEPGRGVKVLYGLTF